MVEMIVARQQQWKVCHFHSFSEADLVCKFIRAGCWSNNNPHCQVQRAVNYSQVLPQPGTILSHVIDDFCAMQILYLLDRFEVSDEFIGNPQSILLCIWIQICPSLQRSHVVKSKRKQWKTRRELWDGAKFSSSSHFILVNLFFKCALWCRQVMCRVLCEVAISEFKVDSSSEIILFLQLKAQKAICFYRHR